MKQTERGSNGGSQKKNKDKLFTNSDKKGQTLEHSTKKKKSKKINKQKLQEKDRYIISGNLNLGDDSTFEKNEI